MSVVELQSGDLLVCKLCPEIPELKTEKDGGIRNILSTEREDWDGDIVHAGKTKKGAGWVLDDFNKNPLVLWQHDRGMPNLSAPGTKAKVEKVDGVGRALVLDPVLFDLEDPVAATIEGKVRRKVIKQSSAGFIGKIIETRRDNEGGYKGREFFEQYLVEGSFANRGANMDTDTMIKSMLGNPSVTAKVEDGGSAAVLELKDELGDVNVQLAQLQGIIKELGSQVEACQPVLDVLQEMKTRDKQKARAAMDLLKTLRGAGLAHK